MFLYSLAQDHFEINRKVIGIFGLERVSRQNCLLLLSAFTRGISRDIFRVCNVRDGGCMTDLTPFPPHVKIRKHTAADRVAAPTPGTVEIHRSLKESEDVKLICRITKTRDEI